MASPAVAGVASPAFAGAAYLADLAGCVIIGVASLANAGAASLANAGVASLADLAGSVADRVMCLTIPVGVASDVMTFPKECDVRSHLVFGDYVCCDSEADRFVCEAPNAWCNNMPVIRGNSVCEYVNYVGHNPDWVDCAVPDDVDGYPEGTLPSEPICVITDDMTYQEKIEALNGTIYDYDAVCEICWTILIMMNHTIVRSCVVSMVR